MKSLHWILMLFALPASALDSILLVRHAEKQDGWPAARELSSMQPLSGAGVARAEHLAELFKDEPLLAVYCSPTTRTAHTALPTARAHGLELQVAEASIRKDQMAEFVAALRERYPGAGSVLIVGHSNTVPLLLRALGASEECDEALGISEQSYGPGIEGYDGIWRVALAESGCSAFARSDQSGQP